MKNELKERIEHLMQRYASYRYSDFHYPLDWTKEHQDVYAEENMNWCISEIINLLAEQKKELIDEILAYIFKNEQWDRDEHYPLEIIYTNGLKKLLNDKNHD